MERIAVYKERLRRVRDEMKKHDVEALVIPDIGEERLLDIRYISGFTGSTSFVVITEDKAVFISDGRYMEQAHEQVVGMDVVFARGGYKKFLFSEECFLRKFLKGVASIGIMKNARVGALMDIEEALPKVRIVALPLIIENYVRSRKDEEEVQSLRAAVRATEGALRKTIVAVRSGISELELAGIFENSMRKGASLGFSSIILSGRRTTRPHGEPSENIVSSGDVLQFDVGCKVGGYTADISRVAVCGRVFPEQRRMHQAVLAASKEALRHYRPGGSGADALDAANKTLAKHGYPHIPHGIGHGIGLEVHEGENINEENFFFREGMVVTLEPGIYSESFGMRVERNILITKNGSVFLDRMSTKLWKAGV